MITLAHLRGAAELPDVKIIPPARLRELLAAAQSGDAKARDEIVLAHMKFAAKYARKFAPTAHPDVIPDLLVAAAYGHPPGENGLIRAIAKFDPTRKASFGAYAVHWIRAAVQSVFRSGTPHASNAWRVAKAKRTRARLEAEHGETSDAQVAAAAGVSLDTVEATRTRHVPFEGLTHGDPETERRRDVFEKVMSRRASKLSPLAAEVVRLRYLRDIEPADVAERLALPLPHVVQLEREGLAELRVQLGKGRP